MRQAVESYIKRHNLLRDGQQVLVALSGGADSVCLLLILQQLGYKPTALHCNFHLRGEESDRDERFVRTLCEKYDITLHVRHFQTREYALQHHISIEMAARDLRYDWFRHVCREQRLPIAVAHHRGDQAETLLLNLLRGTGLRGLAGMMPRNGDVIRPLLCVSRQEILSFLQSCGQDYVTDSTNLQRDATRNAVRLDLLPMLQQFNPQVEEALARTCDYARDTLYIYEQRVSELFSQHGITDENFSLQALKDVPELPIMLHEWLRGKGFNHAQECEILQAKGGRNKKWLSPTHTLHLSTAGLQLVSRLARVPQYEIVQEIVEKVERNNPHAAFFDAAQLQQPLTLRPVRKADRMVPFGMKGSKLVSHIMRDSHLTPAQRQQQMALCQGDEIIWLVNLKASNLYRVTDATKVILRISVREKPNTEEGIL